MSLQLRSDYWDDRAARRTFKNFIITIHGLDLSQWEDAGYWDDDYRPFSFFDGDEIVSSVCVYSLEAMLAGSPTRLAQISSVGTHPEWRRKGLNRRLTEHALASVSDDHPAAFLFSDTEAIPYYTACGFTPIDEFVEYMEAPSTGKQSGTRKLDPTNHEHRRRIFDYAKRRSPASEKLGVQCARLFAFRAMYFLKDKIVEIPDLECLVCFERTDRCLRIFDIVAEEMPTFDRIHPYIADDSDQEIEFQFHTDRLGLPEPGYRKLEGNNPFIKGALEVDRLVFPFTCRA